MESKHSTLAARHFTCLVLEAHLRQHSNLHSLHLQHVTAYQYNTYHSTASPQCQHSNHSVTESGEEKQADWLKG
eukprot:2613582-Rhodomonas_salina.1